MVETTRQDLTFTLLVDRDHIPIHGNSGIVVSPEIIKKLCEKGYFLNYDIAVKVWWYSHCYGGYDEKVMPVLVFNGEHWTVVNRKPENRRRIDADWNIIPPERCKTDEINEEELLDYLKGLDDKKLPRIQEVLLDNGYWFHNEHLDMTNGEYDLLAHGFGLDILKDGKKVKGVTNNKQLIEFLELENDVCEFSVVK